MISVVVPLYNKENFITETIRSVLNQTFTNFELLIVDDGSTDRSSEIVAAILDQRIKIITIQNSGVSVARNTGIRNATYDWVALLDGDDYWAPTFLAEMVKAIEAYPENKLFASGRSRVFESFSERYKHKYLPKDGETQEINYFKVISKYLPLINSSNVIIKKEILSKKGLFRPGQYKHEDHDLWIRLAVGEEVVFVNKNLSFYRKTENDTASKVTYRANDFYRYLSTMILVNEKITSQERRYFKQYYNKYCVLVYLQFYGQYSQEENKMVFTKLQQLLKGKYLWFAITIKILPLKRAYSMYKKIKGQ